LEVSFEPYEKVSFKSCQQYESPEEMIKRLVATVPAGVPAQSSLRWANGVLFSFANFQASDSLVKEFIAGHLLWDHVDFAPMAKYVPEIPVKDKPMVQINVVDVSTHSLFEPFTRWIRDNLLAKTK
jgi:hypothetical protein